MQPDESGRAPGTDILYHRVRTTTPFYRDDRPLNDMVAAVQEMLQRADAIESLP